MRAKPGNVAAAERHAAGVNRIRADIERGQRGTMRIEGDYDTKQDRYGEVRIDGWPRSPIPSQKILNHSPDGFAWGYSGSGPAQLALAILLAAGVSPHTALTLYQHFKFQFIAPLPPQGSFALELDVAQWVRSGGQRESVRASTQVYGAAGLPGKKEETT